MREKRIARGQIAERLRLAPGRRARLEERSAANRLGWDEEEAKRALDENCTRLEHLQHKMYADGRTGMIILLQGIDASGKDGTIRHVIRAFNPQGLRVTSFKEPSTDEAKHDYLWRIHARAPRRGEVAVFNRSHYEEVLAVRVRHLAPPSKWQPRYAQINDFERLLVANDMRVVKLFLHISKEEQRRRFEARVREPHKQWKFDLADLDSRRQWGQYRRAFEEALSRCSTAWAPWYVIPADHKWLCHFAVSEILRYELERLPLRWPKPDYDPRRIRIPG